MKGYNCGSLDYKETNNIIGSSVRAVVLLDLSNSVEMLYTTYANLLLGIMV